MLPSPGRRSMAHRATASRAPSPTPRYVAATHAANQAPGTGPRGSGSSIERRSSTASDPTTTSDRRRRPDADPRIPIASNPARRSTPGDSRSTRKTPTCGGSAGPAIRALTRANRRAGSHVVQVFSPVSRHARPAASGVASVPGIAPRAGEPPPSSVEAALTSAPSSTTARNNRSRRARRPGDGLRSRTRDMQVHREPQRRCSIDGAQCREDRDGVRQARATAAELGRDDSGVQPGRDQRSRDRGVEGVSRLERLERIACRCQPCREHEVSLQGHRVSRVPRRPRVRPAWTFVRRRLAQQGPRALDVARLGPQVPDRQPDREPVVQARVRQEHLARAVDGVHDPRVRLVELSSATGRPGASGSRPSRTARAPAAPIPESCRSRRRRSGPSRCGARSGGAARPGRTSEAGPTT